MKNISIAATFVILANAIVNSAHGVTHLRSEVGLAAWQWAFVFVFITLLPLVALALYWTPRLRLASGILVVSMLAGTAFGIYFHFIADTPDHVSQRPDTMDGMMFTLTAWLLIPFGLLGAAFGAWTWTKAAPFARTA